MTKENSTSDFTLRVRQAARAVLADPSEFPEEFISWLMRKITLQLEPQAFFYKSKTTAAGITDLTSTHDTVTITDPTGPTTNVEVALNGQVLDVSLYNETTLLSNANIFGEYVTFGYETAYVLGHIEVEMGTDLGTGDGDHYILEGFPAIGLNSPYQFGYGVSKVISSGVAYPAFLQSTGNGSTNATIIVPGTTPGGGETIAWAARPTYPATYAASDLLFVGSFIYQLYGGE